MITVLNKYHGHVPDGDRKIGIHRGYPLGNPFPITDQDTREVVIARYEVWLREQIETRNPSIIRALNDIATKAMTGDIGLVCFCNPRPCHGDVIKRLIEERLPE